MRLANRWKLLVWKTSERVERRIDSHLIILHRQLLKFLTRQTKNSARFQRLKRRRGRRVPEDRSLPEEITGRLFTDYNLLLVGTEGGDLEASGDEDSEEVTDGAFLDDDIVGFELEDLGFGSYDVHFCFVEISEEGGLDIGRGVRCC